MAYAKHVKPCQNQLTDKDLLSRRGQDLELESSDEFLDGIIADIEAEEMLRRGARLMDQMALECDATIAMNSGLGPSLSDLR